MAIVHKISTELLELSFDLIALHSSLPSYAMAYYLNQELELRLARSERDLRVNKVPYPMYEWYDEMRDAQFTLVSNRQVVKKMANGSGSLFAMDTISENAYLINEKRNVDYFIKIEHDETVNTNKLVHKINGNPKINMSYTIDVETLKSKDNLILLTDADQEKN